MFEEMDDFNGQLSKWELCSWFAANEHKDKAKQYLDIIINKKKWAMTMLSYF